MTPISFKAELCDSFLIPFKHDGEDLPLEDNRNKPILEEGSQDRDHHGLPPVLEPPKSVRNPLLDAQVDVGSRKRDETEYDTLETHENRREFKRLRKASDKVEPPVLGRIFTRGCPACESGMEAPGIRHSAKCRRTNMPMPEVVVREPVGRVVCWRKFQYTNVKRLYIFTQLSSHDTATQYEPRRLDQVAGIAWTGTAKWGGWRCSPDYWH